MAFANKIGSLLKKAAISSSTLYQSIRCMSSSKLFIGGLSYGTDDQSLREAFTTHGEVMEARVIIDRETGRSRGFGFVTLASEEEAAAAISALDGKELHGRVVRVNHATERSRGFGGGGYGGGGGGYGGGGYGGGGDGYGGNGGGYGGGGGNYGGGGYGGGGNYGDSSGGGGFGSRGGNYDVAGGGGNSYASGGAPGYGDSGAYGSSTANSLYGSKSVGGSDTLDDFKDDDYEPNDYADKGGR